VKDPAVAGSGTLGRGQVKLKSPVRAKQYSGLKDCVSLTVVGRLRKSGVNNRQGVIAAFPPLAWESAAGNEELSPSGTNVWKPAPLQAIISPACRH
jgi:hypothetical protein